MTTKFFVIFGMHAETAVMPGHEFFEKPVVYSTLSFQDGQDLERKISSSSFSSVLERQ